MILAEASAGRIVLWNLTAAKIFGYSPSEALGLHVEIPVPERLKAQHRAGISRYRETGHGAYVTSNELLNLPALQKTGEEIRIEMSLSPINPVRDDLEGGRPLVLAIIRDATERKRVEEEIRRLNEDLENRIAERAQLLEATLAERKRAEEALRHSEERVRYLVQNASDIISLGSTS